jgi:two-component system sensor histidine kinase NblS
MTIQDLTREVELNAAQSRFISNVSHELRTPLFNIKSYVETLYDLSDQLSEEQKHEFLGIANAETDRLTRLVNDVLDLSRLESDRHLGAGADGNFHGHRADPAYLSPQCRGKGGGADVRSRPQLPSVRGNWDLMLQVFDNLVGNGLKFTPAGGRLMLRAYPWPDHCQLDPIHLPSQNPTCAAQFTSPEAEDRNRRHGVWHLSSGSGAYLRAVFPGRECRPYRGWYGSGPLDRPRNPPETRHADPHGQ